MSAISRAAFSAFAFGLATLTSLGALPMGSSVAVPDGFSTTLMRGLTAMLRLRSAMLLRGLCAMLFGYTPAAMPLRFLDGPGFYHGVGLVDDAGLFCN